MQESLQDHCEATAARPGFGSPCTTKEPARSLQNLLPGIRLLVTGETQPFSRTQSHPELVNTITSSSFAAAHCTGIADRPLILILRPGGGCTRAGVWVKLFDFLTSTRFY